MSNNKPRIIKDFEKLDVEIKEQIKFVYPDGFSQHLITFKNKNDETLSALPFETDDHIYLIKMSVSKAREIINEDSDYDSDGLLKDNIRDEYEDKYAELDYIAEGLGKDDEEEDKNLKSKNKNKNNEDDDYDDDDDDDYDDEEDEEDEEDDY